MIGCADIGNTRIKAACFNYSDELIASFSSQNPREIVSFLFRNNAEYLFISSVNTTSLDALKNALNAFGGKVHIFNSYTEFPFTVNYAAPEKIGLDRLFGIAGAIRSMGSAVPETILTVDSGTATTINYYRKSKGFTGGFILPGLHLMASSLHSGTDLLPLPQFSNKEYREGSSTEECITSAAVLATTSLIEKCYSEVIKDGNAEVFLTGGSAEILETNLNIPFRYHPGLVLEGIYSAGRNYTRKHFGV